MVKKNEPFIVPSLSEVDSEYAAHEKRLTDLRRQQGQLKAEQTRLLAELGGERKPAVSERVLALIGDPERIDVDKRDRLAAVDSELRDIAAAFPIVEGRLNARERPAKSAVLAASRSEYRRVVSELCQALEALHEKRLAYFAIRDQLEDSTGDMWTQFGPVNIDWTGDRNDWRGLYVIEEAKREGNYAQK